VCISRPGDWSKEVWKRVIATGCLVLYVCMYVVCMCVSDSVKIPVPLSVITQNQGIDDAYKRELNMRER